MAYIDKTYLSWNNYIILKKWCDETKLIYDNGIEGSPKDFLFVYNEPYEGIRPVWNTPEPFDRWLYHNCPLYFIQERLKEQYSNPDVYFNTTIEKEKTGTHYKIIEYHNFRDKNWIIDIHGFTPKGDYLMYSPDLKIWVSSYDFYPPSLQISFYPTKHLTKRKLSRLIKKWKLPIGTILYIINRKFNIINKIEIC